MKNDLVLMMKLLGRRRPPAYWHDDFSSGVLSPRYQTGGGTWSIMDVGGGVLRLVNVPGLGAERVDDPGFDNAAKWSAGTGWSVGSGIGTKTAGAASYLTDIACPNTVVNLWYRQTLAATVNAGLLYITPGGASDTGLQLATGSNIRIVRATVASIARIYGNATFVGTVDNFSSKLLTTSQLINTVRMASPKVLASVGLTRAADGTPLGLAICMDNPLNPLNYILCRSDGAGNLIIEKILNGIPTSVLTQAYTYGAGKKIYVDASALPTIKYGYDGVQFGSGTISDAAIINNRYHGTFGTTSGASEGYFSDLTMQCY